MLFICVTQSMAQTQQEEMHDTYWFYRYRLTQDFLKKGLGSCGSKAGYSIPGSMAYGGDDNNDGLYPDLKFGDGTSFLGNYIGTLAVELKLLLNNGGSSEQLFRVKEELYFAMKAYERLDKNAEVILPPSGTSCDNSLNGFFLRDDVGYDDFLNDFKNAKRPDGKMKSLTSDYEKSKNLDVCKNTKDDNYRYPSIDQVSNLLVGFSLVVKSISGQFFMEADGGVYNFADKAQFYTDKIAHYLTINDYNILIPNTNCYAHHGAPLSFESTPLSYGVAHAANKIRLGSFGNDPVVCWGQCFPSHNPYASSAYVEAFAGMWQNFFNYPNGKTYVLNNYNEQGFLKEDMFGWMKDLRWPYPDLYNVASTQGHQNNNAVFMQLAAVGNLWRAGLTAERSVVSLPLFPEPEITWKCAEKIWDVCIGYYPEITIKMRNIDIDIYCYNHNLGNQLGGYITNFLFDNASRADITGLIPALCVPFTPLPEFSVNTTSTALSEYGNMIDGQYFPLLHQYLHNCGPYTYDEWNLYQKLLAAPCSGPHYKPFRDVNNPPVKDSRGIPDWEQSSTSTGVPGWQTENRWEKSNASKNTPTNSGGWNGLDYMIAYNLFHSVKGGSYNFVNYEDFIYREIRNKTFDAPVNKTLVGFEKLLLTNTTINSGTNIVLHAGQSIKMVDGVAIKNGAVVSTKIDPVFECVKSNTNTTAHARMANLPQANAEPTKSGEQVLKDAVTQQMKGYKNEFQKAIADHDNAVAYKSVESYVNQVKSENAESEISLFPNPASNKLFLKKNKYESNELTIEIRSVVGALLLQKNETIVDQSKIIELDINDLVPGYYFCKVTCGSYSKTIQFIKK